MPRFVECLAFQEKFFNENVETSGGFPSLIPRAGKLLPGSRFRKCPSEEVETRLTIKHHQTPTLFLAYWTKASNFAKTCLSGSCPCPSKSLPVTYLWVMKVTPRGCENPFFRNPMIQETTKRGGCNLVTIGPHPQWMRKPVFQPNGKELQKV